MSATANHADGPRLLTVLAEARLHDGQPSTRALKARTGVSHTTIAEFFAGNTIPSLEVVRTLAAGVGLTDLAAVDDLWLEAQQKNRRDQARAQLAKTGAQDELLGVLREISGKLDTLITLLGHDAAR